MVNARPTLKRGQGLGASRRHGTSGAAVALREVGQEHARMPAMFREPRAEFLRKERFFAARFYVEGQPGDG